MSADLRLIINRRSPSEAEAWFQSALQLWLTPSLQCLFWVTAKLLDEVCLCSWLNTQYSIKRISVMLQISTVAGLRSDLKYNFTLSHKTQQGTNVQTLFFQVLLENEKTWHLVLQLNMHQLILMLNCTAGTFINSGQYNFIDFKWFIYNFFYPKMDAKDLELTLFYNLSLFSCFAQTTDIKTLVSEVQGPSGLPLLFQIKESAAAG